MKLFNYFLITTILISSCKNDEVEAPIFDENYGEGMYIVTDNGVSFYDYQDSLAQVTNQIYKTVNNITINDPKKLKFSGTKAYIVGYNNIVIANVKTFEDQGEINGFSNPVDIDFLSQDRLFVVDKGDSKVKTVDIESMEIMSDIETGDSTHPVFILSNSYKSFILNGGGLSTQTKDSTVVVIEYRDDLESLANFIGNLSVGDNPNSAVITSSGALKVLCKGVYDPTNPMHNTESSLSHINQYSNEMYTTDNLSGIYNAQNLISNWDNSSCYLTAEGGVYRLNPNTLNVNLLVSVNASVINTIVESFAVNDTTMVSYEMMYMNDTDSQNNIYKYNIDLSVFVDTIIVDGNVRDISFY
ncbi:MAG: hypothetical protein VX762_04370 [Bacteroidota bacterium]|nr:hypothetical protein [Bacteroidota bacterium]